MTKPPEMAVNGMPAGDAPTVDERIAKGLTIRRAWPVWANRVQHRVEVRLNAVTGSARVLVDGAEMSRRGPWHMNMNGFELPFDVENRPCLLVVRHRYGGRPGLELYSEGRSLSTGEPLEEHRAATKREMPNLVRMLLIFIPLIGGFNTVVQRTNPVNEALGGWGAWALTGAGAVVAASGWWIASRWYARTASANRHLVGGSIVAVAWALFFVVLAALISLG